jgi:hypothetical protein
MVTTGRRLRRGNSALPTALVLSLALGAPAARAVDITGAWATDVRACDKIFQKNGNLLTLANRSDTLGGGFISMALRTARLIIKRRMEMSSISLRHVRQI